jgi:CDP-diacylglycerol--glycerol-3-phosphate 3-phosphatidyltransferase
MNEVVGVQHMKIYAFDNDLLLSGANLSDWYFIDRQDRYVLIKGQEKVTNYFEQLVRAMNSVSYMLTRNGELILPGKSGVPTDQVDSSTEYTPFDPLTETSNFVQYSRNRLKTFIEPNGNTRSETGDTWIFPVIQMGPLGIRHDQYVRFLFQYLRFRFLMTYLTLHRALVRIYL